MNDPGSVITSLLPVPDRRKAEWERVHQENQPKALYGGWARLYLPALQRYFYVAPADHVTGQRATSWDAPYGLKLGPNNGADLTSVDRFYKGRIAINQLPELTAAEKLILHEFICPVSEPPDAVFIMLETVASNSGTDRQSVYRAVTHFEALGLMEWMPRKCVLPRKVTRIHPRVSFFRFLPGSWLCPRKVQKED